MENHNKLTRLAISCGGTGGHFYPGLSIARELAASGESPLLLISGKHADSQRQTAQKHNLKPIIFKAAKRPLNPIQLFSFAVNFISGFLTVRKALKQYRPDALLAMGSFASIPAALAALSLKVPLVLHDGNARIGKANRFLSGYAKQLGASFPPVNGDTIKCKFALTGLPVRPELLGEKLTKADAISAINEKFSAELKPDLPLLLIFGGSQGAKVFNDNAPPALTTISNPGFQVIHLCGNGNSETVKPAYGKMEFPHLILDRADTMGWFYSAADLVICRSGGSTVSELACFGKPAVLVPYPYAAENHQYDNAEFYADSQAGTILPNDECTPDKIREITGNWLKNLDTYRDHGNSAAKLAKPDAATSVISMINSVLNS